jgi:hypothetical protein
MWFYPPKKAGPTLAEKVKLALKNEGPARGQLAIAQRLLSKEAPFAEYQAVYSALRDLVAAGEVLEKRDDEWGAPSYVYSSP